MDPNVLLLLSFAGGAIAGALLMRRFERRGGRAAQDSAAELEIELAKLRSELEARGAQISSHFVRSSDLFRDLTERYTQLYAHLADGARQFCPDEAPAIARGLGAMLSAGGPGAAETGTDADDPHRPGPAQSGSASGT